MLLCGALCTALSVSFSAVVHIVIFLLQISNVSRVQASLPPGTGQFPSHSVYIQINKIINANSSVVSRKQLRRTSQLTANAHLRNWRDQLRLTHGRLNNVVLRVCLLFFSPRFPLYSSLEMFKLFPFRNVAPHKH